jgi:hypothetical protein
MSDEPIPYSVTEAGSLALRVTELEHMLRHFDRSSMHLLHYVRGVDWPPTWEAWQLICDQVSDMVDPHGPRNPHG